ncbi:uncharacterized protein LOC110115739 isoform X3 [Dendrobium catenatum]|uniref:uncharacterized protein LOC110115739 isoform X3 n=1 Tax=Dendrobium catenatum TaxID=906689 RepID=UPI0009F2F75F|nr:uncharacterized protein LOC110115739 isoform X3 [Dendrobium catenatum]
MASSASQLFPFPVNQNRPSSPVSLAKFGTVTFPGHRGPSKHWRGFSIEISAPRVSPSNEGIATGVDDDGISLGTMKLPTDTDITLFETLLFQWANSLCQGANLPLPVPLKEERRRRTIRISCTIPPPLPPASPHASEVLFPVALYDTSSTGLRFFFS